MAACSERPASSTLLPIFWLILCACLSTFGWFLEQTNPSIWYSIHWRLSLLKTLVCSFISKFRLLFTIFFSQPYQTTNFANFSCEWYYGLKSPCVSRAFFVMLHMTFFDSALALVQMLAAIWPFFSNDYPGIVSVIEKRLRQKDDSCSDLFFSPADTSYGKFSLLPAYLASIAHDITSDLSSFFVQAFYNDPDWGPDVGSTAIMYKLRSSCIFLVSLLLIPFYMATISLYVFAFAFFLVAYPLPMWFGMFGFKYVLRMLRGIAIAVSFITPVLILAFLLYSPICKRVTNDS